MKPKLGVEGGNKQATAIGHMYIDKTLYHHATSLVASLAEPACAECFFTMVFFACLL